MSPSISARAHSDGCTSAHASTSHTIESTTREPRVLDPIASTVVLIAYDDAVTTRSRFRLSSLISTTSLRRDLDEGPKE